MQKRFFDNLGSISTTFYAQLLQAQIPKAQKNTFKLFALLRSALVKAAHKMLVKLTPGFTPHRFLLRVFV